MSLVSVEGTFKGAMREYAPVGLSSLVVDVLLAFWLVSDMPPGASRLLMAYVAVGVLWIVTLLLWVGFAAKHARWVRRRVKETAAELVAMNEGAITDQHATDLLTCPGPCRNPYGCMVGVCVIASTRRFQEGKSHA